MKQSKDQWHYPRTILANQVVDLFETGLSSALVFFAPRRMGKTEFLQKDVLPASHRKGWRVWYFSFLDMNTGDASGAMFERGLYAFAETVGVLPKSFKIKKMEGGAAGIHLGVEFQKGVQTQPDFKEIIALLAQSDKVLLLLDEIQTLTKYPESERFIAGLRTALDIHKDTVKVIFTGSSREGLRQMFSQSSAPFFHFGQNLPFPELDKNFTDHLADVFHQVTQRSLDKKALWDIFVDMEKVPQLIRALVERAALHPEKTLKIIRDELLTDIYQDRTFIEVWQKASSLEKLLLRAVAQEKTELFGEIFREQLAKKLGVSEVHVPAVQSALRTLLKKNLIGRAPERGAYFVDDPTFKNWIVMEK